MSFIVSYTFFLFILTSSNSVGNTDIVNETVSISTTNKNSLISTTYYQLQKDTLNDKIFSYTLEPPYLYITMIVLLLIAICSIVCCIILCKHKVSSNDRRKQERSVPPKPFEIQLTLIGNSLGGNSKKHSLKVLPAQSPLTPDTPSPEEYEAEEMDFTKKVKKESDKTHLDRSIKFQKFKKESTEDGFVKFQKIKQNDNDNDTVIIGTNIDDDDEEEEEKEEEKEEEEEEEEAVDGNNDNDNDEEEEEEDDNDSDTDNDEDDDEDTQDLDKMDRLFVEKDGYQSGTGTVGISEYEYENEWYEPTLTGDTGIIIKQNETDDEHSTTEDLRHQIGLKLQNKDRNELKKVSKVLAIIKDDKLASYDETESNYTMDNISDYDLNNDNKHKYIKHIKYKTITNSKSNTIMTILSEEKSDAQTYDDNEEQQQQQQQQQQQEQEQNDKKMQSNSPRHDMIIVGDGDDETNMGYTEYSVDDEENEENEENEHGDDDKNYEWIIKTLIKIDEKDGKNLINTFKENKVTDERLKDLREQDWKELIPMIGTRNELRKLHEIQFPPKEGNHR